MKTYLYKPIKILQFLSRGKIQKYLTSKYLSIFNNKPRLSWVAHITRDSLTSYSCSNYNSMDTQTDFLSPFK